MASIEIEIPEDPEELKKWIETQEAKQKENVEQVQSWSKKIQEIHAEEQALKAKLNEMARQRYAFQEQSERIKREAQNSVAAVTQAKRKLETFMSEQAMRERYEAQFAEFDRHTAGLPWREFAFDHQIDGAKRLASARRGILGDKRGLGKTLTSLIWADMLGAKKTLIFAPKDVLENFKREIEHWAPHRHVMILAGMNKVVRETTLGMLKHVPQWTILCNYEAWRKDASLVEHLKNLKADTVIIDEAHNIKERRTSAYQGIRDIVYAENACNQCGGDPEVYTDPLRAKRLIRCSVCLHEPQEFGDFCSVKNVLPMTGTAILNKPQELWTLLHIIDRKLFPSEKAFLQDYCTVDFYTQRWKFRPGGEDALISRLGSRFIRRTKETAGVKFKKQVVVPHEIEFDKGLYPAQWEVMRQIAEYGAIKMSDDIKLDVFGILPELTRRRQAITWPQGIKIWEYDQEGRKTGRALYEAPATESIKMDKAMEIAKEIIFEDEDRLVCFSQFKEALKEFERRFTELGVSVVRYDGDISDAKANEAQLDFDGKTAPNHPKGTDCNPQCVNWSTNSVQEGKYCPGYQYQVILCHYRKGGVGLNLNAARQMIILDREWNPGKEDQAFGRIDRMNNTEDSIVHTIHVSGTIDAFMDDLIEQKQKMIEGFEDRSDDLLATLMGALKDGDLL
ncbi:DEAD/DEAH box helicase [Streptomyces sp. NPDC012769]|uniref:DEAD/DEAH box helicase n=1 Tax=Streptomyces sp. NPDC012769 TaxID=3364848 RepID=UPI0036793A9A